MRHIKNSINRIKEQKIAALPTGMKFLDDNLGGLYLGEMTVICGNTNNGKTALMIRQIHRLAIDEDIPVLIVLNGMSERTFLACMATFYCSIITNDIHQIYSNNVCKNDIEAYWLMLEKKPVYFADSKELPGKNLDNIKQFVSDNGIKVLFFEQASMMTITGWKISRLGYYLKQLAKELQVAVVAEYEFWFNDYEQPLSFQQFENDHFSNFADNIIGVLNFANHQVFVDEKGYNLLGCVKMRIMKHKGIVESDKEITFQKMKLFCRSKERVTLLQADETTENNPTIKAVMDRFDCEIISPECPKDPF